MTSLTTSVLSEIVKLFDDWIFSISYEAQRVKNCQEDGMSKMFIANWTVEAQTHIEIEIDKLEPKLDREIENNLLAIDIEDKGVIYVNKLAGFYRKIKQRDGERKDNIKTLKNFERYYDDDRERRIEGVELKRLLKERPDDDLWVSILNVDEAFFKVEQTIEKWLSTSLYVKKYPDLIKVDNNTSIVSRHYPDLEKTIREYSHIWREEAYKYHTKRGYNHKQDLIALFANMFRRIEGKIIPYWQEIGKVDEGVIKDLIYEFRMCFSVRDRDETINYFDDLLLSFLDEQMRKFDLRAEPAQPEPTDKKSKKEIQLNWKHQLIMLHRLGILKEGTLLNYTPTETAKIIALLLNRTEQDVKVVLNSWHSVKDPQKTDKKYLFTEGHEQYVYDLLLNLKFIPLNKK